MKKNTLSSRVIKTEAVNWRQLQFLQDDRFKSLSVSAKQKLRQSIISNEFSQPFYVWQDPTDSVIYCLDGWHRSGVMRELEAEGWNISSMLPATFVECRDKQEAAKMVLVYSSIYAQVTEDGLSNFMEVFELSFDEVFNAVSLPDFDEGAFMGDTGKDFASANKEIEFEEFTDEIILKLKYSKADFLEVKQMLNQLSEASGDDLELIIFKLLRNAVSL